VVLRRLVEVRHPFGDADQFGLDKSDRHPLLALVSILWRWRRRAAHYSGR
jgi:hypothetical protein